MLDDDGAGAAQESLDVEGGQQRVKAALAIDDENVGTQILHFS